MKAAAQEEGGTEEGREDGEMRSRAVEEVEVEREEGKEEGREEVVTCMLCIGRARAAPGSLSGPRGGGLPESTKQRGPKSRRRH